MCHSLNPVVMHRPSGRREDHPLRLLWKRLVQLVVVLLATTFLSYLMLSLLPGDTADVVCGLGCTQEQKDAVRREYGLDKPIPVRYGIWLGNAVRGDLGKSASNQVSVAESLRQRMPVTLELVLYAEIIAFAIGIPSGLIAAQRSGGVFDRLSTTFAFAALSAPPFVLAPILVLLFAVTIKIFPATGYEALDPLTKLQEGGIGAMFGNLFANLRSLFLPALILALAEAAVYLRLLRTDIISTLQEDYIQMAKAKGLSPRRVLLRHAFRPSTFSLVTVAGLNVGRLIGGTLIVEVLFALNGLGSFVVQSILKRDYIPVLGGLVVIVTGFVLVNFAVDMLYAVLDPRIRHARAIA